ncbi:MAG: hypothetical protein RL112_1011 [Planctomycetota bacterium]
MAPGVLIVATLDTKGVEADYVRGKLAACGVPTILADAGTLGEPRARPDVAREELLRRAGASLEALRAKGERGAAVAAAAAGARALALELHARGELLGVLGLGGSAGTTIATEAMRALPIGVPKLCVSTLASGQTRAFVGDKDIVLVNSVVDVLGLNRVSRRVLSNAAHAMAGMVLRAGTADLGGDKPLVAATMFGVTTPCVERAKRELEAHGLEVLVFHATGTGGQAMETLVKDGLVSGVLDITTTELADELVGGVLSAGPERLSAAARSGVPQVVSTGALDMVNFHGLATVPERFRGRRLHAHNANTTLMRTTVEENAALGRELGAKVAAARGPAEILLPSRGVSALDRAGAAFDDPAARRALHEAVRAHAGHVPVRELDLHVNDEAFALEAARTLLRLMGVVQSA